MDMDISEASLSYMYLLHSDTLHQQIAAKQRDITTQRQQAKIHGCP